MVYPVDLEFCFLIEPFGTTSGREFPHTGDDFARRKSGGKPLQERPDVYAAHDGEVIAASWHAQAGNRTIVAYDHGIFGVYGHQAEMHVKPGGRVVAGQRIGLLGGTGKTSGPHLHYAEYTSRERAVSGVVQYWKNKGGSVLWPTVTAWADASGLIRPDYRLDSKATNPLEEDFMAPIDEARFAALETNVATLLTEFRNLRPTIDALRSEQVEEDGLAQATRADSAAVRGMLAELVPIIRDAGDDADRLARELVEPGENGYSAFQRVRSVLNELEKRAG